MAGQKVQIPKINPSASRAETSACGTNWTLVAPAYVRFWSNCDSTHLMAAFGGKADIAISGGHVCF
jgi:hypothetical protein